MATAEKGNGLIGAVVGVAFTTATLVAPTANADELTKVATTDPITTSSVATAAFTGKPVTLRVGKGFDHAAALIVKATVEDQGCAVTLTTEPPEGKRLVFPKRLTVEVGDDRFKAKGAATATITALDWCLES